MNVSSQVPVRAVPASGPSPRPCLRSIACRELTPSILFWRIICVLTYYSLQKPHCYPVSAANFRLRGRFCSRSISFSPFCRLIRGNKVNWPRKGVIGPGRWGNRVNGPGKGVIGPGRRRNRVNWPGKGGFGPGRRGNKVSWPGKGGFGPERCEYRVVGADAEERMMKQR